MRLLPKFTIITVTRNAAATLEDTIQSVIAQTYHRVEYLIVDGQSTDGTLDIARRYADHITRLVSEPDRGLYDAMNKAILMATGDYLCFLNAGDCLHADDTLTRVVHLINRHSTDGDIPDIVYGHTAIVDRRRHFLRMRRLSPPDRLDWRSFRSGMLVCHQAFWAKRGLCMPYNLKYRYSSDFDWCIRVMRLSKTTYNTGLTLIDYLDQGLTTQHHRASLRERFHIMAHYYGLLPTVARHLWFAVRSAIKR